MSLASGTRLGPYEIQSAIGAGGMGEVYKARDTRLDRTVAIKVLPPDVSGDPERRARFEREAKTVAGLNHPHICTLHDVGDHDGQTFLVMEHLTGQTLAERLEKGPLPLEQALKIATEIAEALSAAHRQGVVHRDLKPANVMLTKSGAKLLDFGLAKLTGHGEQPAAAYGVSAVPTQAATLTGQGTIVGTLQYMAPEQLEGKPPDARTDLWALGAILYEMLTGKRAFEGTSVVSVMSAIMEREPTPIAALQPLTPSVLDRLVRQCLGKNREDRPDTAHDVANDLRWAQETSVVGPLTSVRLPRRRLRLLTLLLATGCAVVGLAAGAGVMWSLRPFSAATSVVRSTLLVGPADELNAGGVSSAWLPTPGGSRTAMTWAPDGQALVFVGRHGGIQQLYVRRLDAPDARSLPNTEEGQVPAVSPDGAWVAFWARGAIKRVPFGGGPAVDLAPGISVVPKGLVWDAHGGVFFARSDGRIWVIPAEGKPAPFTTLGEGERTHELPSLLPGGRVLLYTVRKRMYSWGDESVVAQPLPAGNRKLLVTDATDARFVSTTGHLLFMRRGAMWAVPFDAGRLEVQGQAAPIIDGIAQALTATHSEDVTGAGQFAVSPTGTLAWVAGKVVPYRQAQLVTVDRRGQVTALPAPPNSYGPRLRLSPDGRRLVVTIRSLTEEGLWIYDLTRSPLTPLNRDGESQWPVWTPDGQRVVFAWLAGGRWSLAMQSADHPAAPLVLWSGRFMPSSWHPDRRTLAGVAAGDLHIATVENEKATVQPLWQSPANEYWPEFSPDGQLLAYGSNISDRFEVYVGPYPGPGRVKQVSLDAGSTPVWHPTGRELFFVRQPDAGPQRRMMAVDFVPGPGLRIGSPRVLFEFDSSDLAFACTPVRCHDVSPDGQRFYVVQVQTAPPPRVTYINLVTNWFEELKAKVPSAR